MPYTTTELLADIRRSGMLPSNSSTGTADADLLAQADKEMQSRVIPLVMSTREEFYVRSLDYALTASQSGYRIPSRAIGAKLRDVELVLTDGTARNLPRIPPEDAAAYAIGTAAYPTAFYVERDSIVVVPTPSTTNGAELRLKFFARPSRLVAVSATATPTVSTVTANYSGSGRTRIVHSAAATTITGTIDIVRAKSGFEHVLFSVAVAASGAGYVEIADADAPSDLSTANNAGDYLSAEDTTPVLQCPVELHNYLAQRTLCRVLQALGDSEGLRNAEADAEQMKAAALQLLSNRVDGEPKKVVGGLLWRRSARGVCW